MADGIPKDYSRMYSEDNGISTNGNTNIRSPILSNNNVRANHRYNVESPPSIIRSPLPPIPSTRASHSSSMTMFKPPEGAESRPVYRDQEHLIAKLNQLRKEDHHAYAMDTLNKHFSSVFVETGLTYKVYIQYFNEKDTYVVRVNRNTFGAVRSKMPIRGNFRYFFRCHGNTCEEIESYDSTVPYHDKDGQKVIYCQVFPV